MSEQESKDAQIEIRELIGLDELEGLRDTAPGTFVQLDGFLQRPMLSFSRIPGKRLSTKQSASVLSLKKWVSPWGFPIGLQQLQTSVVLTGWTLPTIALSFTTLPTLQVDAQNRTKAFWAYTPSSTSGFLTSDPRDF